MWRTVQTVNDTVVILPKVIFSGTAKGIDKIWKSGNNVDVPNFATHLGIVRDTSGTVDISGTISVGRKTVSLMGFTGMGLRPLRTDIHGLFLLYPDCCTVLKFNCLKIKTLII